MQPNPEHLQFCICICIFSTTQPNQVHHQFYICILNVKPPPNQVHHDWKVSLNKNLRLVSVMERVEIEVPSSNAHCAISFQTPSRHQLVFSSISSLSYTSSSSILLLIPSPGGRVDQIRGIFQGHPGPYCPVKFQSWVRPKASALSISHSSQPGSNSCLITGAEHSKPKGEQKTKAEIGREGGGRQPQKLSSY